MRLRQTIALPRKVPGHRLAIVALTGMLLAGCAGRPAGPIDPTAPVSTTPPPATPPTQPDDTAAPTIPDSDPSPTDAAPQPPVADNPGATGLASYYGMRFAGNLTASGERFDPGALTAAHRTLPFGTRVRVTNLDNGEAVTVRINDRGPFAGSRIIDLSRQAAEHIGMIQEGVTQVRIQVLQ